DLEHLRDLVLAQVLAWVHLVIEDRLPQPFGDDFTQRDARRGRGPQQLGVGRGGVQPARRSELVSEVPLGPLHGILRLTSLPVNDKHNTGRHGASTAAGREGYLAAASRRARASRTSPVR